MRSGLAIDVPGADGPGHGMGLSNTCGSDRVTRARLAWLRSVLALRAPGGIFPADSRAGSLATRSAAVFPGGRMATASALAGPLSLTWIFAPYMPASSAAFMNHAESRPAGSWPALAAAVMLARAELRIFQLAAMVPPMMPSMPPVICWLGPVLVAMASQVSTAAVVAAEWARPIGCKREMEEANAASPAAPSIRPDMAHGMAGM